MNAFLITIFTLYVIATGTTIYNLGAKRYPRVTTTESGSDVLALLINFGLLVWIASLLEWI